MPSPKDFPSSGSFRAPKMMTIIKMIRMSSVGPTGPIKNIKTSSEGSKCCYHNYSLQNYLSLAEKSREHRDNESGEKLSDIFFIQKAKNLVTKDKNKE